MLVDGTELTETTTSPMTLEPDYSNLYEKTAEPYSACFPGPGGAPKGFFKWGNPTGTPATATSFCNRDVSSQDQDCWGKCLASDVVTDEKIAFLKAAVETQITYFQNLLRIPMNADKKIVFKKDKGQFYQTYLQMGRADANEDVCMADCSKAYNLATNPKFCTEGTASAGVLIVSMMVPQKNIGGYGGACQFDQNKRSTALFINMNVPDDSAIRQVYAEKGYMKKLIQHEMLHAFGFSQQKFQELIPENIQLINVQDKDGTTDELPILHFIKGKVVDLARDFFNCPLLGSNNDYPGLPTMGANALGTGSRGSHWETRIMADDVLSYSNNGVVSDLTVAVYEDLGLYLGNYSTSGCMRWGAGRGCDFVRYRCGVRDDDFSQSLASVGDDSSKCGRTSFGGWDALAPSNDPFVAKCVKSDCAKGPSDGSESRLNATDGHTYCNAECLSDDISPSNQYCKSGITSVKIKTTADKFTQILNKLGLDKNTAMLLATILLPLLIICFCSGFIQCLGKDEASLKTIYLMLGVLFLIADLAFFGIAIYGLTIYESIAALMSENAIIAVIASTGIMLVVLLAGLCGSTAKNTRCNPGLWIFAILMFFFMIAQIVAVFYLATYGMRLDEMTKIQAEQLGPGGRWEGAKSSSVYGVDNSKVFSFIDAWICRSYRTCCKPDYLDTAFNGTCLAIHNEPGVNGESGGAFTGGASIPEILADPGREDFCSTLTGSTWKTSIAPKACDLANTRGMLDRKSCTEGFCLNGAGGYLTFLNTGTAYFKRNAVYVAMGLCFFLSFEFLLLLCSFIMICKKQEGGAPKKSDAGGVQLSSPMNMGGDRYIP